MASSGRWITRGSEDFSQGTLGNAGQNIYVSRAGIVQRVHQFDIDDDGYDDLVLAMAYDGIRHDLNAIVYYGSPQGFSERYQLHLPAPGAVRGGLRAVTTPLACTKKPAGCSIALPSVRLAAATIPA